MHSLQYKVKYMAFINKGRDIVNPKVFDMNNDELVSLYT